MNTEEFITQYRECYTTDDVNTAIQVYQQSQKNPNNFCLLGRLEAMKTVIGGKIKEIGDKKFLLIEGTDIANFYVTNSKQAGNVLREDKWSVGVNDAWVLGGIEGRSTFNFVSDEEIRKGTLQSFITKYIRSQSTTYPVTITAREILGLLCGQYTPYLQSGALLFTPSSHTTTPTIGQYHTNIENHKTDLIEVITDYLTPVFS